VSDKFFLHESAHCKAAVSSSNAEFVQHLTYITFTHTTSANEIATKKDWVAFRNYVGASISAKVGEHIIRSTSGLLIVPHCEYQILGSRVT
jgi:hypothetical protein